jgi:uncharacterized repeat protein (TIGR01451 family)
LLALVLTPAASALQPSATIDLELTKTVVPQVTTVGENVTWTLTVPNRGPGEATSVEVHDVLPVGLTYVSHSGAGTLNPSAGIWAIGAIPAGEEVAIEIVTRIDTAGDLVNSAEVTMADQDDIDSVPGDGAGDDWDDATVNATTTDLIDLELVLEVDPNEVPTGEPTTLTVDLVNQGPDDATGVTVALSCPPELTYQSDTGGAAFDSDTGVWTVGDVNVGDPMMLDVVMTVDTVGEWICGAEVSTADQEDIDSVPGDGAGDDWDDATVTATTGSGELIDLELTLTADPVELPVGEVTTWTVDLANQGPDGATGVVVTLACPPEVTHVSSTGDGIFDAPASVWAVGDLDVNGSAVLAVTTTVDSDGEWTCVAEVTAADQEDVDSFPNDGTGDDWDDATVTATTGSSELIDLELTLTVEPRKVSVGEIATWTVDLTNQGPDDATGVTVALACPASITYVSHTGDGAFDSATNVWTVGDLDVDTAVALEITSTVDAVGRWTCVAEVTAADQEDVDSVPNDGVGDDWDRARVRASIAFASAIIGDTVWLDADADGLQDAGEVGVAGVTIVLTALDTNTVVTTVTNADGLYLFAALDPGNYRTEIDMTTVDSKLTLTTVGSYTIVLADNEAFLTADFGIAEQLPATGFDPIPISAGGLILALLGAVILELMWPEREGRRLFMLPDAG